MQDPEKYNPDSFDQGSPRDILGLEAFKKSLEKIFFCDSKITINNDAGPGYHLILELRCNFKLINALVHPDMGSWVGIYQKGKYMENLPFERAFMELNDQNEGAVEIAEIYLYLLDTTITISKINDNSLSYQVEAILLALRQHFAHFTKGLVEIPFEIYIPVFEIQEDTAAGNINRGTSVAVPGGYFDFWGMDFVTSGDQNPMIYDLKKRSFIQGDFLQARPEI